jgi:16S rRNA (cytidine1402-2'-O)-methyltransferase
MLNPEMPTLYIIATPIGNLGDITFRAVETLKSVSLVACEDTRRTLKLLTHLGIRVKLLSLRGANEAEAAKRVLAALEQGADAAYVSDAGTPALSDPGAVLVRLTADAGFPVVPIPGASAFASLLSVAGASDKAVVFEGFLSPKGGRRRQRVAELMSSGMAFVLYESPFRIAKLLKEIADFDSVRYVCVGREMTKLHEEYLRGGAGAVYAMVTAGTIKGEFAVYVSSGWKEHRAGVKGEVTEGGVKGRGCEVGGDKGGSDGGR